MKKISFVLTSFLLMFCLVRTGFAQLAIVPVDEDTKLITYKDVVTQEGDVPKLYNTAIAWVNANYENPTEVTRVRDIENGKLDIRHRFKVYNTDKKGVRTDAFIINYNLKLEFKPGRYRYTFTDFSVAAVSKYPLERWLDKKDPLYTLACDDYLAQVDSIVNTKIESLKEGMVPKVIKKDDW
jgi:hypothetical protein